MYGSKFIMCKTSCGFLWNILCNNCNDKRHKPYAHVISVLTALFRIFWKLHFRLFCSTIKYVYKTLHFLVKQLHNTTSAVNNYHSSFHHNYHTKTGILHWLWIQEGSSTSYVSLHSSVNVVWHHSTCPTNFNKSLEWSPDSVWGHRARQHSLYQLPGGRHWVTKHFLSLPPGRGTVTAASTLHSFRRALKTHLFTASFPPP